MKIIIIIIAYFVVGGIFGEIVYSNDDSKGFSEQFMQKINIVNMMIFWPVMLPWIFFAWVIKKVTGK